MADLPLQHGSSEVRQLCEAYYAICDCFQSTATDGYCSGLPLQVLLMILSALLLMLLAAARHVLEVLEPLSVEQGGPLLLQHVSFVEGRGNIIVQYPGQPGGGVISFVGAHMVRGFEF